MSIFYNFYAFDSKKCFEENEACNLNCVTLSNYIIEPIEIEGYYGAAKVVEKRSVSFIDYLIHALKEKDQQGIMFKRAIEILKFLSNNKERFNALNNESCNGYLKNDKVQELYNILLKIDFDNSNFKEDKKTLLSILEKGIEKEAGVLLILS